jgi:hypothetical protein
MGRASTALGALIDGDLLKAIALLILATQLCAVMAAGLTHVMLHGDGSFFVFAIEVGRPWGLKWSHIASRAAVYVLTVLPSVVISRGLHLSPMATADLNGAIFYGVVAVQFAAATWLAWRARAEFLVFLAVQYVLSFAIGFGFPSEILLAPGFLWICLYLCLREKLALAPFLACLLGLVFTHELALPSALVATAVAARRIEASERGARRKVDRLVLLAGAAAVFGAFVAVRAAFGGDGSDSNAIYVFDPRRVLDNPTLLLMLLAAAGAYIAARRRLLVLRGARSMALVVGGAALIPIAVRALWPSFDYAAGRYESARTIAGLSMFVLSSAYGLALFGRTRAPRGRKPAVAGAAAAALLTAIGVSSGAGAAFLSDWLVAFSGFRQIVSVAPAGEHPQFVSVHALAPRMGERAFAVFERLGFDWVTPYRSIVVADGAAPRVIVYGDGDYRGYCRFAQTAAGAPTAVPQATLSAFQAFACAYTPPPGRHAFRDFLLRMLHSVIGTRGGG